MERLAARNRDIEHSKKWTYLDAEVKIPPLKHRKNQICCTTSYIFSLVAKYSKERETCHKS